MVLVFYSVLLCSAFVVQISGHPLLSASDVVSGSNKRENNDNIVERNETRVAEIVINKINPEFFGYNSMTNYTSSYLIREHLGDMAEHVPFVVAVPEIVPIDLVPEQQPAVKKDEFVRIAEVPEHLLEITLLEIKILNNLLIKFDKNSAAYSITNDSLSEAQARLNKINEQKDKPIDPNILRQVPVVQKDEQIGSVPVVQKDELVAAVPVVRKVEPITAVPEQVPVVQKHEQVAAVPEQVAAVNNDDLVAAVPVVRKVEPIPAVPEQVPVVQKHEQVAAVPEQVAAVKNDELEAAVQVVRKVEPIPAVPEQVPVVQKDEQVATVPEQVAAVKNDELETAVQVVRKVEPIPAVPEQVPVVQKDEQVATVPEQVAAVKNDELEAAVQVVRKVEPIPAVPEQVPVVQKDEQVATVPEQVAAVKNDELEAAVQVVRKVEPIPAVPEQVPVEQKDEQIEQIPEVPEHLLVENRIMERISKLESFLNLNNGSLAGRYLQSELADARRALSELKEKHKKIDVKIPEKVEFVDFNKLFQNNRGSAILANYYRG